MLKLPNLQAERFLLKELAETTDSVPAGLLEGPVTEAIQRVTKVAKEIDIRPDWYSVCVRSGQIRLRVQVPRFAQNALCRRGSPRFEKMPPTGDYDA